ncbi:MAG TPA: tyrosine-type recombinase/integrase [Candidatus Binatia bacterium]|jgi:integrase|nr:tyrosine-type recombinase/integrase [Candidatus Binatia bacterium]
MATVLKRNGSKYWCAVWRDAHGKQIWRSTKQTDRTKALADALDYERADKLSGAGSFVEAQARKIVNDIMERAGTGDALRNPITADWLKDWIATKEAHKAASTAVRYKQIVDEFVKHLGNRARRPLSVIVARDIEGFLAKRKRAGCSPTTINMDGKILRTAFNKARREGLITTNPAEAVDLPDKDSVERGTFTPAEVKMLVDSAKGEWKALILLGYFTGARLSDCCRLAWKDVDLTQGTLTYIQRKTGKAVTIPLHPELQTHLEKLASTDKPEIFVMPGMADKGPGGRHGLSESFKGIVRKAGIDLQTVQGGGDRKISRRTFHALRHSFTSALANAGVAPELRMKLTGHSSESVHRGYTHHELAVLKDAVSKLPSLNSAD